MLFEEVKLKARDGYKRLQNSLIFLALMKDKNSGQLSSFINRKSDAAVLEILQLLLEDGCDPTVRDSHGNQPIHMAIQSKFPDCVQFLLNQEGVDVNSPGEKGNTPLHSVFQDVYNMKNKKEVKEILTLLLEKKAKHLPNEKGEYPIHWAAQRFHADGCEQLVKTFPESASLLNEEGQLPIELAICEGDIATLERLCNIAEMPQDLHQRLVTLAVRRRDSYLVKYLINYGEKIHLPRLGYPFLTLLIKDRGIDEEKNHLARFGLNLVIENRGIDENMLPILTRLLLKKEDLEDPAFEDFLLEVVKRKNQNLFFMLLVDRKSSLTSETLYRIRSQILRFDDQYTNLFKDFINEQLSFVTHKNLSLSEKEKEKLQKVIEMVLEYSDYSTLKRLQGVSKAMKERCSVVNGSQILSFFGESFSKVTEQFLDKDGKPKVDKYCINKTMGYQTEEIIRECQTILQDCFSKTLFNKRDVLVKNELGKVDLSATYALIQKLAKNPTSNVNLGLNNLILSYLCSEKLVSDRKNIFLKLQVIMDMGCSPIIDFTEIRSYEDEKSPLLYAAYIGDRNIFKLLFDQVGRLGQANFKSLENQLIIWALKKDKEYPYLKQLSDESTRAYITKHKCDFSVREIIESLLAVGCNAKASHNNGSQAIHFAVQAPFPLCVELLLNQEEVDVNSRGVEGNTALHFVFCRQYDKKNQLEVNKILDLLLKQDAQHLANENGVYPIHYAAHYGYAEECEILVEKFPQSANLLTREGNLPIELALSSGYTEVVKKLLPKTKLGDTLQFLKLGTRTPNPYLFKYLLDTLDVSNSDIHKLLLFMLDDLIDRPVFLVCFTILLDYHDFHSIKMPPGILCQKLWEKNEMYCFLFFNSLVEEHWVEIKKDVVENSNNYTDGFKNFFSSLIQYPFFLASQSDPRDRFFDLEEDAQESV
ncbi:MAG: ankyrin repeat domain-containing protein [Chlamydiales bacterium]